MPRPRVLLLIGASGAQLAAGGRNGATDGLYPPDSPVLSLSSSALSYAVQSSSPPILIEYYAEWCGHCQHYAPTYVKVAEAMKRDAPSVLVAAINCATHTSDCSAHGVHSYPTLKLFGAPADPAGAGLLLDTKVRDPAAVVRFVRTAIPESQTAAAALPGRGAARVLPHTQRLDSQSGGAREAQIGGNHSSGTASANLSSAAAVSAPGARTAETMSVSNHDSARPVSEPNYDLVARLPIRPQRLPIPAADIITAARWSLLHEISAPDNELDTDEPAAIQRFDALKK
jgi:thiol-disulfide isomerase/thioredoxin